MFTVGILTASDMSSRGQRKDTSGLAIREMLDAPYFRVIYHEIVPDEQDQIARCLMTWTDDAKIDLIITTGGTGFTPRDVTPEATLQVIDREAPGLAEAMRAQTMKITPLAIVSRAVAGIRGSTLIVNLPGSEKAVRECLSVIKPVLPHALDMLKDTTREHPTGE